MTKDTRTVTIDVPEGIDVKWRHELKNGDHYWYDLRKAGLAGASRYTYVERDGADPVQRIVFVQTPPPRQPLNGWYKLQYGGLAFYVDDRLVARVWTLDPDATRTEDSPKHSITDLWESLKRVVNVPTIDFDKNIIKES